MSFFRDPPTPFSPATGAPPPVPLEVPTAARGPDGATLRNDGATLRRIYGYTSGPAMVPPISLGGALPFLFLEARPAATLPPAEWPLEEGYEAGLLMYPRAEAGIPSPPSTPGEPPAADYDPLAPTYFPVVPPVVAVEDQAPPPAIGEVDEFHVADDIPVVHHIDDPLPEDLEEHASPPDTPLPPSTPWPVGAGRTDPLSLVANRQPGGPLPPVPAEGLDSLAGLSGAVAALIARDRDTRAALQAANRRIADLEVELARRDADILAVLRAEIAQARGVAATVGAPAAALPLPQATPGATAPQAAGATVAPCPRWG